MAEPGDKRIAVLAQRQRGFVTRSQLMELGLGAQAIRYRVKTHRLIPVYAGVYAVGHIPTFPQHQAFGALLACGPEAVLSHGSAAALWGVVEKWGTPFELTTPTARRRKGIKVHRSALERHDIRKHLGLRVTSPARTLLDIAPRLTERALRRAVNDQLRRNNLKLSHLEEVLARLPRSPGAAKLRPFLELPDGNPTRSHIEDDYQVFAERHGLPRPQVNVWVAGREVDAFYPEERVIVELDGWEFHSDRDSFEKDRERDAGALALGIATIRLTKARMRNSPETEARRVRDILAGRKLLRPSETEVRPSRVAKRKVIPMKLLLRHKLLLVGVIVAAAAMAGGAYAATQSNSNPRQAYLNDVAKRLNVSPSKLDSALKGALIDRLNAMVKAGKLTQAQASKIESRISQGHGRLPFFFGATGFGGHHRLHFGLRGAGPNSPLHAAASYVGLSDAQLISALGSGKSLAQVAQSHGKSVSGLEQAIITAEKARMGKLVSAGVITSAQEQKLLSRLSTKIDRLVNRTGLGHLRPHQGPMMPPPGGTAGPAGPTAGPPPPAA